MKVFREASVIQDICPVYMHMSNHSNKQHTWRQLIMRHNKRHEAFKWEEATTESSAMLSGPQEEHQERARKSHQPVR